MVGHVQRSLVAAAVLVALALGTGAATAPGTTRFADPVGDVTGGPGPDLTSVSVSHTSSTVTFSFRFAKTPPLGAGTGWVDMLVIGIDVPPRSLKRGPRGWMGLDYFAGLHGADRTAMLVKASPAPTSQPQKVVARPKVAVSGHTLAFSVSRRALGNPSSIDLVVAAGRETSDQAGGGGDEAPNHGTFHYRLTK